MQHDERDMSTWAPENEEQEGCFLHTVDLREVIKNIC